MRIDRIVAAAVVDGAELRKTFAVAAADAAADPNSDTTAAAVGESIAADVLALIGAGDVQSRRDLFAAQPADRRCSREGLAQTCPCSQQQCLEMTRNLEKKIQKVFKSSFRT